MVIINSTRNTKIADNCKIADTFPARFRGLIGVKTMPAGSGLLLTPCNSIHMFFMRIPLDIIFLDSTNTVIHLIENIKPWRISPVIPKACRTLELPAGTIKSTGTVQGNRLELITNRCTT